MCDETEKLVLAGQLKILEAMIPAINEIEGGYEESVRFFVGSANSELRKIGSMYKFKIQSSPSMWGAEVMVRRISGENA